MVNKFGRMVINIEELVTINSLYIHYYNAYSHKMVPYLEGVLPTNSHDHIIMWFFNFDFLFYNF